MNNLLSEKVMVNVRFNEADPLGMVWHGHYIRYFEDAREAFGNKYGIGYLDFYNNGFIVPIVNVQCNYKAFASLW
jgi:acyl-CoA thioester hydrolase